MVKPPTEQMWMSGNSRSFPWLTACLALAIKTGMNLLSCQSKLMIGSCPFFALLPGHGYISRVYFFNLKIFSVISLIQIVSRLGLSFQNVQMIQGMNLLEKEAASNNRAMLGRFSCLAF